MSRTNEYGLPKLSGTVSMTKIKNELKRDHPELVPMISNIRINGQLQGCSGFITDPATEKHVYISTEVNHGTTREAMFREAKTTRDYTGGRNHFCGLGEIVEAAVELLKKVA